MKNKNLQGFTLLEILLVVAAIGILAGIVILAINPSKQLGDTRNAQRKADVNTILNAVYQYSIDNNGTLPPAITSSSTEICRATSSCGALVNLDVVLLSEKYLTAIPQDPKGGVATATSSGYSISKNVNNRVTITASQAEQGVTITATR